MRDTLRPINYRTAGGNTVTVELRQFELWRSAVAEARCGGCHEQKTARLDRDRFGHKVASDADQDVVNSLLPWAGSHAKSCRAL
ncbi:hypothetical protein [Streptomyces sp. NBRC 109706]|uniref:hypothetical protein n=1 Tax=Streptomyces sp. NBRC 109706 TaxID=1550035 RepID=UPI000785E2E8|nr:hypothetical protein [Streptomyces sp. NBRC 109706]